MTAKLWGQAFDAGLGAGMTIFQIIQWVLAHQGEFGSLIKAIQAFINAISSGQPGIGTQMAIEAKKRFTAGPSAMPPDLFEAMQSVMAARVKEAAHKVASDCVHEAMKNVDDAYHEARAVTIHALGQLTTVTEKFGASPPA